MPGQHPLVLLRRSVPARGCASSTCCRVRLVDPPRSHSCLSHACPWPPLQSAWPT